MTKNCKTYFEKGAEAAAMNGYSSANRAACNIKKAKMAAHSSGMSHGGKRRTQRKRVAKKSRKVHTKKSRKVYRKNTRKSRR